MIQYIVSKCVHYFTVHDNGILLLRFLVSVYHVGSPQGWSSIFWFKTQPAGNGWSPKLAVFGDMGNVNAQSLGRLQEETERGHFDAILHVGKKCLSTDAPDSTNSMFCSYSLFFL